MGNTGNGKPFCEFIPETKPWVQMETDSWPSRTLRTGSTYLQVDDGHRPSVSTAHDAVEVLQPRGQEGPEGARQPHGSGLLETLEICPTDTTHASRQWGVQCHQVELPERSCMGHILSSVTRNPLVCGLHTDITVHTGRARGGMKPVTLVTTCKQPSPGLSQPRASEASLRHCGPSRHPR